MRKMDASTTNRHTFRTANALRRVVCRLWLGTIAMTLCGLALASPLRDNLNNLHVENASLIQPSATERDTLRFLYQQTKLNRDIYRQLHNAWGILAFADMAHAEQRGMSELRLLQQRLQLEHLPAEDEPGVFFDSTLSHLYRHLSTQGLFHVQGALMLGALIEEMSIVDLRDAIAESRSHRLDEVYTGLLDGAYTHLRALQRHLARGGVAYQAQLLPQEQLDAILNNALTSPDPIMDLLSQASRKP